jgi:metallo-beta-lactamase family protein
MTTKISFHGADHNVTGSCHLIECNDQKLLIDCGLYQGERELSEENDGPFGFEPAEINFLLLTHAHLDHCGRIPLLIKRGFKGEIITTAASRELARLILLDSGHLQEAEAEYQARKVARSSHHQRQFVKPLYTVLDALNSMDFFGRVAGYTTPMDIAPGIRATFLDAGHILGSASIYLELVEEGKRQTILFSGDLGYNGRVILRDPSIPPRAQVVVMETTYGDRVHKPLQPSIEELYGAIEDTFRRGGNVVIPTFALERAQEILYFLHEGVAKGRLPTSMQVFLDSPMAISATEIFQRHPECYDAETAKLLSDNQDPFSLPGLHLTRETAQSIAVNNVRGGAVIMAGSGMCTGGRVRHHLKHNLWRPESSVIFVGYAARGTLARRIVDGATTVRIYHEEIPVRAKIFTIGGFSAHADQAELLAWHRQTGNPERTFLVHGDKEVMKHFAAKLSEKHVEMPGLHQEFIL